MAKKSTANTSDDSDQVAASEAQEPVGKGRPTPTRRQAEAANARPLVGGRDKSVIKQQKQQQADARERARLGMMQGDERYLTARDRGPQRRYVRDYVDARWSVGELLIPMMLIVLVMTFIPGFVQVLSLFVVWGFLGLSVIDAIILGMRLKKKLGEKFGADKLQSGFRWYAAMRALQFRMLRMPKPQVKRGAFPK
ncbi:MAG: DUF3043 domain-containing protein [Leucobacter sp.]